jgi:hypothetical protein
MHPAAAAHDGGYAGVQVLADILPLLDPESSSHGLLMRNICYLCNRPLTKATTTLDHVPAKQFYAPAVRKIYKTTKLLTLKAHKVCNEAYQSDEDYFLHAIMPFARGSVAGNAIYQHVLDSYRRKKNATLVHKVLGEFDHTPSGLILPGGKIVKRFDGERIRRVAWKIVRGLYFHHHGVVLPDNLETSVSLTAPGETPPDHFLAFNSVPNVEAGPYPGAFAYRFQKFSEPDYPNKSTLHYWALLFWDRVIVTVIFHDPACPPKAAANA